jgi:DNA-binding NtrC family response regulator
MNVPSDQAGKINTLAILVVDDEPLVLREIVRGLRRAGWQVQAAGSADEALAVMSTNKAIGVVVTDIRMPGTDGLALAALLLGRGRDDGAVEVVLVTGHASIDEGSVTVGNAECELIHKPFRLSELKSAVRRAMGRVSERRIYGAAGVEPASGAALRH